MFRKGVAPGFEPEISSPGKKEQIFGKNPPVAALVFLMLVSDTVNKY